MDCLMLHVVDLYLDIVYTVYYLLLQNCLLYLALHYPECF